VATDNLEKAIEYSVEGIKAAMWLNGGVALAVMTLMGAVGKGDGASGIRIRPEIATIAVEHFGTGTLAAAATFPIAYLAQLAFYQHEKTPTKKRWEVIANLLRFIGIGAAIWSLVLFYRGVSWGTDSIMR
jgi:hypothetical protein